MLNPRKISVRAEIGAELTCYAEENVMFSTAPEETGSVIHVLERQAELTAVSSVTEKTFVLTDEFELPSDRSTASEIVAQEADAAVQELRSVGSKLIVKGVVRSALLYAAEDGTLEQLCFQTAFSQIIETESEAEDALFEARMMTSGMYYELTPGSDGRSVSMELHLVAQAVLYGRRQVRYLADAYSNSYALQLARQTKAFPLYGREALFRDACTVTVDTAGDVSAVISCHAAPVEWSSDGGEIAVQLLLRLCWRSGETICSAERTITARIRPDTGSEAIRVWDIAVTDVYASPAGGGIELRIPLELRAFTVCGIQAGCIERIEYDETAPLEPDDRPTLVILFPGYEGDLWTLAKAHCSTPEAICAANELDDGVLHADRLLLIPKSV